MVIDAVDIARLAYLAHLANEDSAEQRWVRTLREYYDGEHPVYLNERLKEFLGLKLKNRKFLYSHNVCKLVVNEVVGRLSVIGFSPVEARPEDMADENWAREVEQYYEDARRLSRVAMRWWDDNNMAAQQDDLYEAALRDGEAYIIVDWFDERPRWTVNLKFDGTQGVKLHRDPNTGEPVYASKRWQVVDAINQEMNGRTRLTLYFPDRVEKYINALGGNSAYAEAGWEPFRDSEDEPWPIPWPYGRLAVVPFANPGGSELADVIPLQDALNKADIDLLAGQDMAGFPIYWASGVQKTVDPTTGKEKQLTIAPGRFVRMTDPQARMGKLESADLERMTVASRYWLESIAGVSSTPLYRLLTGGATPPSGDSLEMQEAALVAKIRRKQPVFGDAWESVITLSALMWNALRPADKVPIARLATEWRDPRSRRQKVSEAKEKMELGVPREQIWAELGYTPAQIEQFREMLAREREADANLGEMLLRSFEQGR